MFMGLLRVGVRLYRLWGYMREVMGSMGGGYGFGRGGVMGSVGYDVMGSMGEAMGLVGG